MIEVALTASVIANLIQAAVIATLAGSVPFLWWQLQKQRDDLAKLDEVVTEFLEASGIGGKK